MPRFRLTRVSSLVLLAYLGGCATATYRFRVVNAQTGGPIAGVRVSQFSDGALWNNRLFYYFTGTEFKYLPASGTDGLVAASGVRRAAGFSYTFRFEKAGFVDAELHSGIRSADEPWSFFNVRDPSYADWHEVVVRPGAEVVMPMVPDHAPAATMP